eukprot:1158066-Pelagomonas_calceolata.AAC.14
MPRACDSRVLHPPGARCEEGAVQVDHLCLGPHGLFRGQGRRGAHEGKEVAYQHAPKVRICQGCGRCGLVILWQAFMAWKGVRGA